MQGGHIPLRDLVLLVALVTLAWVGAGRLGGFAVQAVARNEPFRFDAPRMATFWREVVARTALRALSPFGAFEGRMPGPMGDDRPVLLVAEPGSTRHSMAVLALYLRGKGRSRVLTVDCGPIAADLPHRAGFVADHVASFARATGGKPVDVVAFAVGGLAVAWSVRHLEVAPLVHRFVSIGTPWQGTQLAVFGGPRTPWEIRHGAPVLDGLVPPAVPTTAIWGDDDPMVVPAMSAAPTGATCVRIPGGGHHELLLSARVYREVLAALDAADPAP